MRAVRVGVDARHLAGHRGVAHYTAALLSALARAHPGDEWSLLLPRGTLPGSASGPRAGAAAALAAAPNVRLRRHPLPSRALFGAAAIAGRPRLDRMLGPDLDVVWEPAPAPLALSGEVPYVLTVHDLSFLDRPRDFTPYERLWHRLARPARLVGGAARVIAVSEAVGRDVRSQFGVSEARLAVVPSGVATPAAPADPSRVRAVRERFGLAPRYLLFVGALEPRKAPGLLARAFARARAEGLEADLVFAGDGRERRHLGGPGVHRLGYVTPDDLDALYTGALALVLPSWQEGYGFPPLEALARGTPAVVSDLPVYAETLGAAALRFPAGDEAQLSRLLLLVAGDPGLRERLVGEGRRALAGRTWEEAARRTRAVLAEAAGQR